MRIGIIGSGNMGRTLDGAWADAGHQIFFGSRNPEKGQEIANTIGPGTQGGSNNEAAKFAEVILFTVRRMPSEFLDQKNLFGKILIDCNNRNPGEGLTFGPPPIPSFAEQLAQDVPDARVVKCLNTMAQEVFDHEPEELKKHQVACFVAGNDPDAKSIVSDLTQQIGLFPFDCGSLEHAWMLEAAGDLIRYIIIGQERWTATFSIAEPPATQPRFGGRDTSGY